MQTQEIFERELNKNTVFKDRNLITPHYTPDVLPFREQEISEVSENLALTLSGKRPDNLFIYGKTGTGKTSVTRHVLGNLLEFAKGKNVEVDGCYVNCRNYNSKYKVLMRVVRDFYENENFLGFSASFVYDKLMEHALKGKQIIVVLDEIDKVKDLDELVYSLTRANDELGKGSITVIGISNNLMFKDRLDPRTKSSLCKREMVFPSYNAEELKAILKQRAEIAFKENSVESSAINLASAYAAQESGDARTAVMLLLRAGEIADKRGMNIVTEAEVKKARKKVEQEIIYNMITTLPDQQKLVLYAISLLSLAKKPLHKITGKDELGSLYSGEVYDKYCRIAKQFGEEVVSSRWYREYINELEMFGLILTTNSGKGVKGQTRFISLGMEAEKVKELIEKVFGKEYRA